MCRKKQVKQIAKKLHYSPNPIAQSLKSNRTTTLGVVVLEIKHDLFSSSISGIEEVAYQSGYATILRGGELNPCQHFSGLKKMWI